ncbi:hypothetical protein [Kitasatospora aureofaciens]|uniref:hypothetical protein n=1 Tax=Kitasatospora aureofaciens TaxID=1894 RepID=UPI0036F4589C
MPSAPTPQTVREIADGYASTGPALGLGAVLLDGTAHPSAQVRVPLEVLHRHGLVAGPPAPGRPRPSS